MLNENLVLKNFHDGHSYKNNEKTVRDKLYAVKNTQLLKMLKNLNIILKEVNGTNLGYGLGTKDTILVYKK